MMCSGLCKEHHSFITHVIRRDKLVQHECVNVFLNDCRTQLFDIVLKTLLTMRK